MRTKRKIMNNVSLGGNTTVHEMVYGMALFLCIDTTGDKWE